jgi:NAD(P)-dependent dehydrogenase (short-subunit alcohol dehydrogenase family)
LKEELQIQENISKKQIGGITMRLQNRVTLITGAASGIGRATAIAFAQEGAFVCLVDINEELGIQVEHEILAQGIEALFVKADVALMEEVKDSVERTIDKWGRIDILINNAAIPIKKTVIDLEEWEWDRMLDVNLKSMYLYAHLVVPTMIEQGGGVILNMSSLTGLVAVPEFPGYIASKTGAIGLTRSLALDHGPQGIRAISICPSAIDTPQMDWFFAQAPDPDLAKQQNRELHPLRRMAKASEVAALMVFLASDDAAHITGAAIPIDGGYSIY